MYPLCLSFGTHCPKNGVGLAQLLDQKFDFLNFFLASKFKNEFPEYRCEERNSLTYLISLLFFSDIQSSLYQNLGSIPQNSGRVGPKVVPTLPHFWGSMYQNLGRVDTFWCNMDNF